MGGTGANALRGVLVGHYLLASADRLAQRFGRLGFSEAVRDVFTALAIRRERHAGATRLVPGQHVPLAVGAKVPDLHLLVSGTSYTPPPRLGNPASGRP